MTQRTASMKINRVRKQDCITGLKKMPQGSANLVFADPPFNIGFEYDDYDDDKSSEAYLDWSRQWIMAVDHILDDNGAFWLAIGDEYAAELKLIAQECGFRCRSWVVWYYTFGVHCHSKFTRSHAHIFHFIKEDAKFIFNDREIRVPSARQLVYNDRRANSIGRLPDDTFILRPQDFTDGFTSDEDTWYFPRVAGTFKERAGFHGCQMPEQLLGRIIKATSHEGDLVVDPFSGSGTTLAVAKKLGRQWLGFDISPQYVDLANKRIDNIRIGDPLDGAEEPKVSAPSTHQKKRKSKEKTNSELWDFQIGVDLLGEDPARIVDAFQSIHRGFSVDRVVADPLLNEDFQNRCDRSSLPGTPAERNRLLFSIRKKGLLRKAGIVSDKKTTLGAKFNQFLHGSEIAWRSIADRYCVSLDLLLCDPRMAKEFDEIAKRFAPGFESLDYRWGAIKLRKLSSAAKVRSNEKSIRRTTPNLMKTTPVEISGRLKKLPKDSGVYSIHSTDGNCLFVGEAESLAARLESQLHQSARTALKRIAGSEILLRFESIDTITDFPYARQCRLVSKMNPLLNAVGRLAS